MNTHRGVEISATSVDEAVELALEQLGLTREEVEVEVLREPHEPDEQGYVSDEALVYVAASAPRGRQQPGEPVRPRRRLSPGDRMRVGQSGQEILSDLLHHLRVVASCRAVPSTVNTADPESPVVIEIDGEELGVLIGRKGENLESLQYILNLIVHKQAGVWPNIALDAAGYRRRREDVLDGLARRMSRRVAQTQQPFTFEPMSARERRIIHMALQDDEQVYSESTGDGEERRVVIYPADR